MYLGCVAAGPQAGFVKCRPGDGGKDFLHIRDDCIKRNQIDDNYVVKASTVYGMAANRG